MRARARGGARRCWCARDRGCWARLPNLVAGLVSDRAERVLDLRGVEDLVLADGRGAYVHTRRRPEVTVRDGPGCVESLGAVFCRVRKFCARMRKEENSPVLERFRLRAVGRCRNRDFLQRRKFWTRS